MERNNSLSRIKERLSNNAKNYTIFIAGLAFTFALIYLIFTSFLIDVWFKNYVVYAKIGNFSLYFFILAMIMLFFALLLTYRSLKYGLTSLIFMLISVYTSMASYLFGWINWSETRIIPMTGLYEIQLLTSTLSLYFLFFHFELNDREKPRSWLTILITICLIPYCLKNVYSLLTLDYGTNTLFQIILRTLVQIGAIIVFSSVLLIGIRMSKSFYSHSHRARILGAFQFAGIVLFFLNMVFEFLEGILDVAGLEFSTYNTPIIVIALLLISIPLLIDPELLGLVPPNVQAVGVIDIRGITHYFKALSNDFEDIDEQGLSSQLIGGLTIAFANVSKEVARSKAGIDSLKFGDRAMIIEYLQPYYFVVIAERATYFLNLEMKHYTKKLKELYNYPPTDGSIIPEGVFKELNKEFFPILTPSYFSEEIKN